MGPSICALASATALTTKRAASPARSPARNSPTKSAYPGVSMTLIFTSPLIRGARARLTLRCWRCSAGSQSHTVVPPATEPARVITPACASSISTSVVFPAPDGPTRTTLRTVVKPGSFEPPGSVPLLLTRPAELMRSPAPSRTCRGRRCSRRARKPAPVAGVTARGFGGRPVIRPLIHAVKARSIAVDVSVRCIRRCIGYARRARAGNGRRQMLASQARPQIQRVLDPLGRRLAKSGLSPDVVTVVGTIGVSAAAVGFFSRGSFLWGTLAITLFVFSDMLDGLIARARGTSSRWGAFLDSSCDRIADSAIFGAASRSGTRATAIRCRWSSRRSTRWPRAVSSPT